MSDRQCSSCGGFCKKSGCERENVAAPSQEPVAWRWPIGGTKAYDYQSNDFAVLTHMPCGEPLYLQPSDAAAQIAELKEQLKGMERVAAQRLYERDEEAERADKNFEQIAKLEAEIAEWRDKFGVAT